MLTRLVAFSLVMTVIGFTLLPSGLAQEGTKVTVPLSLNTDFNQSIFVSSIRFDSETTDTSAGETQSKKLRHGTLPGGLRVSVESATAPPNTHLVKVDSNGDGNCSDEKGHLLVPDVDAVVHVPRRWGGGKQTVLPYIIKYSRYLDKNQVAHEAFSWRPRYAAEGKLRLNNCESDLKILDLDGDGIFDREDFRGGTTVQLDGNGDGRIWGADEHLRGEQVIRFCGKSLLVDGVEASGSSITFGETSIAVPELGEAVPAFAASTLEGKSVGSEKIKGKVVLLDFWASWCAPCVKKFPRLQEIEKDLKGKFDIVAINVDEAGLTHQAKEVIKEYSLTWPQVMNGRGQADPLWKMFGNVGDNRLSIPLYVLIDMDGRMQYADHGGEDLNDLKKKIEELLNKR